MMSDQQLRLLDFVIEAHRGQPRKYKEGAYWFHVYAVGMMAAPYVEYGFEIGLCHDLFEDTKVTYEQLVAFLLSIGYPASIADNVHELTDEFTKDKYPHLNRKERKMLESERLWTISPKSQTVKYCDIDHNSASIKKNDTEFFLTYREEKFYTLQGMHKGDPILFQKALQSLDL